MATGCAGFADCAYATVERLKLLLEVPQDDQQRPQGIAQEAAAPDDIPLSVRKLNANVNSLFANGASSL